ncbi:trypsin-like peptidase domain-containing protein [Streptomyces sp. Li-HN-5-11]|uniref:trypsin-like peptidase domain-containing protein n=1 Tax=Streptomyces sp. Li-HN-5-11 TaxID=3075432 RepID=UPI0037DA6C30
MAGREPRATVTARGMRGPDHTTHTDARTRQDGRPHRGPDGVLDTVLDASLVFVRDLTGRPRGIGFAADHDGTVITSHEAVDGVSHLVLRPCGGDRSCVVTADAVTSLPGLDLALVHTEGLGLEPLPVTAREGIETGTYVRIAAGGWREARVLGAAASVTYTATDGCHLLGHAVELAIGTAGRDALRPGGGAAGGPVLDAATGTVVAVLGTALRSGGRESGFAVPLLPQALGRARAAGTSRAKGPLAELLARNAATVPAYGPELNLAGVLELTATSVAQEGPRGTLPAPATACAPANALTVTGRAPQPQRPEPAHSPGPAPEPDRPATASVAAAAPAQGPRPRGPVTAPASLQPTEPARVVRGYPGRPGALGRADDRPDAGRPGRPVERAAVARELAAFAEGPAVVLGLVGAPGSGRTTELAALAARRARGSAPAPTLWLRGADLEGADDSVADAAVRALDRAARIVAASRAPLPTELADLTPERVARLTRAHGRPLLLLLDGPEEMPPALAHRLSEWTEGTAQWLRGTGARLVVACREEYWEEAGARFPQDLLHTPGASGAVRPGHAGHPGHCGDHSRAGHPSHLPPCLHLGDLTPDEAREARARYGIPDGALVDADARHALTLRLLAEVRAALPGAGDHPPLDRHDVLAAYLDLMCLRIAVRLAAENGLRGTAVRRLAGKVSGQVHEAARRSLGTGRGELDRATFEEVFWWGPAPAHLGGGTGWAAAVLAEGLLVPAGSGYRFAHEELADWIQGTHLDLDEALRVLVHRRHTPGDPHRPRPVPHHRIGPVVQALLLLARQHGARRLAVRLEELVCALDTDPQSWWASRLLAGVLLRLPDAAPYARVLRLLADRLVVWRQCDLPVPHGFGPGFWTALHLPEGDRCDLLRRLLLADDAPHPTGPPGTSVTPDTSATPGAPDTSATPGEPDTSATPGAPDTSATPGAPDTSATPGAPDTSATPGAPDTSATPGAPGSPSEPGTPRAHRVPPAPRVPRYLDAAAHLLAADPRAVQPHLTRWFDDERALPAAPHATVATAAQALLYAHRHRAVDDLTETLAECAHQRAGELLAVLAEEEPSALCRAVDRWAHDARPARRAAAVTHGLRVSSHVRTEADRELLRHAALALLSRPADAALHGGALALLVGDPHTRARHLPQALRHFAKGDPHLPPAALAPALTTHPEAVLTAFGERMLRGHDTAEALRTLADVTTPTLARRVAALIRETVARRPESAGHVAAYVDRRLDHGPAARAVLFPLVTDLLGGSPEPLRAALGGVLAAPGGPTSQPLRRELLDFLLAHEDDPAVLDAVLHAAAPTAEEDLRDLVHRLGLLLVRTPEGAAVFDRGLVELARHVPGFAARVAGWLTGAPRDWAGVVGPSARRMIGNLAGEGVPV